jgi:uncharacterized protein (DUF1778 family)
VVSTYKKFTVRCTAEQEQVIREAALVREKSVHDFITDEAYEKARRVLLAQKQLSSNPPINSWEEFKAFLEGFDERMEARRKLRENRKAVEQRPKDSASVL